MSSTSPTAPSNGTGGSGAGTVSTTASTPSTNMLQQLPSGTVLEFQTLAGTITNQGHCLAPSGTSTSTGNGTGGSGTGRVSTTASTTSKNLPQQLPSGAVLAFQTLAGTFTNQGHCFASNWWLTVGLVTILSSTCIIFPFTDSLVHKGKVYYGVALPGRLNILNMNKREETVVFKDVKPKLRKLGLKTVDFVHAFLSLVVFLTIVGSDVGLQNCFFPNASLHTQQLLKNLPLGMAVVSSFLFMIFPTTRKGIRFDNRVAKVGDEEAGAGERKAADRVVMSSANPVQLLPSGPVLAFQTLAASFTNQGQCLDSNWWLAVGLLVFLSAICIFSSFTDCVQEPDTRKVHWAVALPNRLYIMGMSNKDQVGMFGRKELCERRVKIVDYIHAFFSAVAFLTIAGSDVGMQKCFFPNADDNTQQLLRILPLATAAMSSFVFMVFPTTRNSMSFDDSDNTDKKQAAAT